MTTTANDSTLGYSANAQFWSSTVGSGRDRFRVELTDPAVLQAAGPLNGQVVLDAGCGEGYLSRKLAADGAGTVVGVDPCSELVELAQGNADNDRVTFANGSLYELDLPGDNFDVAVLNHVVNDLEHLELALSEVARVLKSGGQVVAMMLHPCFYWPWRGLDEKDPERPTVYWKTTPRAQSFHVDGEDSPSTVVAWYRPLTDVFAAFSQGDLLVTSISEPAPSAELLKDPWWTKRWTRPMFMMLTATKAHAETAVDAGGRRSHNPHRAHRHTEGMTNAEQGDHPSVTQEGA